MSYNWNWHILLSETGLADGEIYLHWIGFGLAYTFGIAATAWILAFLLGCVLGMARTGSNKWLARLASGYVEVFRNVPLLVQLFIWYFVVPEWLPRAWSQALKSESPYILQLAASLLCLGTFTSARVCEQLRSGIEAIGHSQRHAALALGLSSAQIYRHVLLPQALRNLIPSLTSEMVNVVKNSAVCSTIGLMELSAQGRQLVDYTAQPYEAFLVVTVVYVLVNLAVLLSMALLERKMQLPGMLRAT
ncbi:amino acid ABC transporter permease [Aquabacterium sp.]|uniref:amino acid ABC transporter permease n=1 Tax=Aquabacterium sp. TaxID=1872578 RepID=UPI004037EBB5